MAVGQYYSVVYQLTRPQTPKAQSHPFGLDSVGYSQEVLTTARSLLRAWRVVDKVGHL